MNQLPKIIDNVSSLDLTEYSVESLEDLMQSLMKENTELKKQRQIIQTELDRRAIVKSAKEKLAGLSEAEIEAMKVEMQKKRETDEQTEELGS